MTTSREHMIDYCTIVLNQRMNSDFSESLQKKAVIYAKESLSHVRVGVCPRDTVPSPLWQHVSPGLDFSCTAIANMWRITGCPKMFQDSSSNEEWNISFPNMYMTNILGLGGVREGSGYQIGWIFGKIPNDLWPLPPPLTSGKLYCNFFSRKKSEKKPS